MKMKSPMMHSFSDAPTIEAPRSRFNRSFAHTFDLDAGWLVPFYWDAVLPGDTFTMQSDFFARMATPLFPLMHNLYADTHYFFIPNRLVWSNWRKFCGEQENPADSIDYQVPVLEGAVASDCDAAFTTHANLNARLLNYFGVPDGVAPDDVDISALPFRCYSRVWNEWFRDQNLQDSRAAGLLVDDGADDQDLTAERHILLRRGKRHDYFTSGLVAPQKGDAVTLPLGSTAPVAVDVTAALQKPTVSTPLYNAGGGTQHQLNANSNQVDVSSLYSAAYPLYADLTNATASTVNDIREAFQIQRLLERDARAGTRYSELIRNHFGVDFYDVSYRPEYLGGGSTPINITPVATTTELTNNVGDLAAFATFGAMGHGFTKSFVEHGYVLGLISIRADLKYQQGLNRHFSHSTRYDFYWPSLAHLGNQATLSKEIYCDGTAGDEDVFNYQERYAEYRYKPSMITGKLQSAATTSLDPWHLAQEFASRPVFNAAFIEETPPMDRVVAQTGEPDFIVDSFHSLYCARPIPLFGVPGMIDHF